MGYDVEDYHDIHEAYGTLQDCQNLINECHDNGLRIVFDLVINQ